MVEDGFSPACSQGNPSTEDVELEVMTEEANQVPHVCEDVLMDTSTGQEGNIGGGIPSVTSSTAQVCSALCFLLSCSHVYAFIWVGGDL